MSRQPHGRRKRFGQHPPPVSKLIKNILDRYPDGQIFKVGAYVLVEGIIIVHIYTVGYNIHVL